MYAFRERIENALRRITNTSANKIMKSDFCSHYKTLVLSFVYTILWNQDFKNEKKN